ncbi:MAG: hypothetical protein AAGC71_02385 [Pseudomonadota bacterium]
MTLARISSVTYQTRDIATTVAAIKEYFAYRVVAQGEVDEPFAEAWRAPALFGAACVIMQPVSGTNFYLRFIEASASADYAPLMTFGWNAAELLVDDVYALADRLASSPFQILGGPRDLLGNGTAVALQVRGPGDEVFYLTQISGKRMQATYGAAVCPVDRLFIAVLGVQDHAVSRSFYRELGAGITRPRRFPIRVISNAHGLDPDSSRYLIGGACLDEQYRIEIDAYPNSAIARPIKPGGFPPGLGLVSIDTPSLDVFAADFDVVQGDDSAPYFGARFVRIVGPDNEWLELIERS